MRLLQGMQTAHLPHQKRRSTCPKILHLAHGHLLLRVPREAPRRDCARVSMPKKSPPQLLRSSTPATWWRSAPPSTNIAVRTNLVRSPVWTNTAPKSLTRSLARKEKPGKEKRCDHDKTRKDKSSKSSKK